MANCVRCDRFEPLPERDFCWACATDTEREGWWGECSYLYLESYFSLVTPLGENGEGWMEIHQDLRDFMRAKGYEPVDDPKNAGAERFLFLVDWSGMDLQHLDLSGRILACSRLEKSNLTGANLKGAVLSGANLTEAELYKAILDEASIWNSLLMEAKLGSTSLKGARLAESDLRKALFVEADLEGAYFGISDLSEAVFYDSNMRNANFCMADLRGAILRSVNLEGADFYLAELNRIILDDIRLRGAKNLRARQFGRGPGGHFTEQREKALLELRFYWQEQGFREDEDWALVKYRRSRLRREFLETFSIWELIELMWRYPFAMLFRMFIKFPAYLFLDIVSKYGTSLGRSVASSFAIVLVYALVYKFSNMELGFWQALYLSLLGFATLGFGNIRPLLNTSAEAWVVSEIIMGYIMFGVLVWVIIRKVSR
ncbi:MAG: pentapeptide repeat-containing protein [candidate division WOR-3 bacterium]